MTRRLPPASSIPLILISALILHTASGEAQGADPVPYTLHVYTNLIQIPTLVLSTSRKPLPPIPLQKFDISLDAGPTFHPSQIRLEGDDPISLAILLDASLEPDTILKNFPNALAALASGSLHPDDHVSIYAVDCTLVRSTEDTPASPAALREGVLHALSYPTLHGKKKGSACGSKLRLWDAVTSATQGLANFPGRRVLLIVSDGIDGSSQVKWNDAVHFANWKSVAIFGLRSPYAPVVSAPVPQQFGRRSAGFSTAGQELNEDPFRQLCELDGGMILNTRAKDLAHNLESFVTLLRNRYILEFPRANDAPPGSHNIEVTIPKTSAFITTSGVIVPVPDPKLLADPNTVPSAPTQVKFGTRRPLDPATSPH